jgi:hypothetical protein
MTNREVAQKLGRFGISVSLNDGTVSLTSARGVPGAYSARGLCPVVGLGADDRVFVRVKADGDAEFVIDGQRLNFSQNDVSDRLDIPQ